MPLKLEPFVKEILLEDIDRADRFLDKDEITRMTDESLSIKEDQPRETIIGYPSSPLYKEVANMLQLWMQNKECPITGLPKYDLLDEKVYVESREAQFASIMPMLEGLQALSECWTKDEIKHRIREVLKLLGKRGILDLLGVRKTVGTVDLIPPSRKQLLESFVERHSPNSQLTVGARALAKHFHRDNSSSWWGNSTGTELNKNDHATEILEKILNNATWINIHWLPQDVYVIEARQQEGYGVRWTADGKSFRGFLEPQMVDGHAAGWKH